MMSFRDRAIFASYHRAAFGTWASNDYAWAPPAGGEVGIENTCGRRDAL
jgi:hypothetical protein